MALGTKGRRGDEIRRLRATSEGLRHEEKSFPTGTNGVRIVTEEFRANEPTECPPGFRRDGTRSSET